MNVFINRTDAIGDTILTLPMAYEIKRQYPHAKITFLVMQRVAPVLEKSPVLDHVWTWGTHFTVFTNMLRLWRLMKETRPDYFFHVGGKLSPVFMAWVLRIPVRAGILSKWPTFFCLNHGERQSRSMVTMHESQYNINLLFPLKISFQDSMVADWKNNLIALGEEESNIHLAKIHELFERLEWDKNIPYMMIHPGMTGHSLNWPITHYAGLIKRLLRLYPGKLAVVVSSTPSDQNFISSLQSYLGELRPEEKKFLHFFNGAELGLRHYMQLIKGACLFLGPSTGPSHLANFLGVSGIFIYSPIKTQSSRRWGPLFKGKQTNVFVPDVICGEDSKCAGTLCPYYECMPKIEVEEVFQKIEIKLLEMNLSRSKLEKTTTK